MNPQTAAILVGVGICWTTAILISHAARKRPWVSSLSERTVLAFALAVYGTLILLLTMNTDAGFRYLSPEDARTVGRGLLGALLIGPSAFWLVLYLRGFE